MLQNGNLPKTPKYNYMNLTKHCDAFCHQMGLCANKNEKECEGFIPMDSEEEEQEGEVNEDQQR